jgi:hypothetical protein
MKHIVLILAFALEGVVLALGGLTVTTWHYWAVTLLTGIASIALAWRNDNG